MRVGIITFEWFDNYGTVLQAFALQETLRGLGHDVHIIPLKTHYMTGMRRFLSKTLAGTVKKIGNFLWERGNRRRNMYQTFRRRHFAYSDVKPMYFEDALKCRFDEDLLVFGSDNIWSPWCVKLEDGPMSSLFFGDGVEHPRKVAYAASTGAYLNLHPQYLEAIRRIKAAGFAAISLREGANAELFRGEGLCAEHVPDPTLLLAASEWERIEDESIVPKEQYVMGYGIGHIGEIPIGDVCQTFAKRLGVSVCMPYPKSFFVKGGCFPDPCEWLSLMRHAMYVVTDSFHGVLFSLIYRRPFIFLPAKDEGGIPNMRAFEILKHVRLEDRILEGSTGSSAIWDQMSRPIDWECVGKIIDDFRQRGINYLRRTIV